MRSKKKKNADKAILNFSGVLGAAAPNGLEVALIKSSGQTPLKRAKI